MGCSSWSSWSGSMRATASSSRDQAFVDHVDRGLDRGSSRSLRRPGLQQEERVLLHRELDVLHVAVVLLEPMRRLEQLRECLRSFCSIRAIGSGVRMPATTSSPCALARNSPYEALLACRGVTRERNAGSGLVALVAEHHLHDVHRGAEVVRDVVHAPVTLRAG